MVSSPFPGGSGRPRVVARAVRDEFVYRHRWWVGDLVMWDKRSVMHTATPFDAER